MKKYKSIFREQLSDNIKTIIDSLIFSWDDYNVNKRMKEYFEMLEEEGYMKNGSWLNNKKGKEANKYFDKRYTQKYH